MVTTNTIRNVGRRLLLAMLASAGPSAWNADLASAQSKVPVSTNASGAATYSLNDIKLAPGETLVGPATVVGEKTIQHGGGNYQIIDAATASTLTSQLDHEPITTDIPMLTQPQMINGYAVQNFAGVSANGGCSSCGNSGCSSCGGGGYGGYRGHNSGKLGMSGNACGPICNPYLYASGEVLYMTNNQVGNYTRSPNFSLNDYDYHFGLRATLGIVPDCRNGMEFSFVGPFNFRQSETREAPGGGIGTFLTGVAPITTTSFVNAVSQTQRYDSDYFTIEANRTLIGWEICKFLLGMRYADLQESYLYRSRLVTNEQGFLASDTTNRMIGAQLGAEMTYPLSCKLWSDFRGRAGIFANFAENNFQFNNAGVTLVRTGDDDIEAAGLIELGGGLRYYLTDDLHIRGGVEMWYLTGIAAAGSQFSSQIGQTTGTRIDVDEDLIMAGVTLGAELKF